MQERKTSDIMLLLVTIAVMTVMVTIAMVVISVL